MSGCNDGCGTGIEKADKAERRVLIIVLIINAGMFLVEFGAGIVSQSVALLADSLDMLADAMIYALGLFALGRAPHWKVKAAMTSGIFQMILGIGIALQAVWRLFYGEPPDAVTMGIFGALALIANTISFILLAKYRDGDINMRATWLCTRNDMIGNVGVLLAAGLVAWLSSPIPDVVIGLIIAIIIIRSAWHVVKEAYGEGETNAHDPN